MARVLGDWLHIRKGLSKAREVVAIASMTRRSRQEVVGWLFELWSWFDSETEDGNMVLNVDANVETTVDALETLVSLVGADKHFWHAVAAVGWLHLHPSGLSLPNFKRWMGESAKKRLNKNISQQGWRLRQERVDANVETAASTKRTPDKSRVDIKNPPTPQGVSKRSTVDSEDFQRFWSAYPRKTAKENARKAWDKLKPGPELLAAMLQAIEWQKQTRQWQEGVIPHPATWLNGKRWEDQLPLLLADPDEEARRLEDERRKAEQAERKKNALPGGLHTVAEILNGRRQCPNPKS